MKNNESKEIKFTNASEYHHIGFFERIKRSIFNVEKYGEFLLEKTRVSIKYFFLLTLIIAIVVSAVLTYQCTLTVSRAFNYIKNEMPNFIYEDGIVKFERYAEGYDKDEDFYNIIDPNSDVTEETVQKYVDKIQEYSSGVVLLSGGFVFSNNGEIVQSTYKDFEKIIEVNLENKDGLVKIIDTMGIGGVAGTYFVASILSEFLALAISYFLDILTVCIFGYLVARIVGIPLNWSKTLALAIYSMTLSMLLSMTYTIVYSITGFVIEYFSVMYLIVAYIYIISAILIIKSDLIKQQQELQKIYKVEAEVKKELDEQKEKDKEENKENKKEDKKKKKEKEEDEPIVNGEPDGSEI